ncbi:hypothetical protein FRC10_011218 [Ceratobasidium sp. 414]|nr:hypothetical protein FRC10_011218 [Ceratobasidium sp. 414]
MPHLTPTIIPDVFSSLDPSSSMPRANKMKRAMNLEPYFRRKKVVKKPAGAPNPRSPSPSPPDAPSIKAESVPTRAVSELEHPPFYWLSCEQFASGSGDKTKK